MPKPLDLDAIQDKMGLLERIGAPSHVNVWQNEEVRNMVAVIEALQEALGAWVACAVSYKEMTADDRIRLAIQTNAALALVKGS